MRPSSPLLDSMRDLFEGYEQLAKDFTKAFKDTNALCDIVFNVGQGKDKVKVYAVRAILAVRSRVFQEMLYGIASGLIATSQSPLEALNRAVTPTKLTKSSNFLQVPDVYEPRHKSAPSSPMVMRAFSRLARWDWSGKKQDGLLQVDQDNLRRWTSDINCHEKKDSQQDAALLMPRLSVCADAQKVDRNKLLQSEFNIIEFDPDTFETLLEYLHTGSCPLTCRTIPGLICAAEHFDLPELLQACFHHAKQHLHTEIVCAMLNSLENYYWRYTSASELVNMILLFVDTRSLQVFECRDFYELSESMVQMILSRELSIPEVQKFHTMLEWSRSKIKHSPCRDSNLEFRCTMERLTRDLKLYNISPTDLIKVVLPSKAIRNERILDTLMYQANTGMYRVQPSYIQECRISMQERRESRPDMKLFGMHSFDRRDSWILNDDPDQPDTLLAEHMASVRRQQSLNQDMLLSSMEKPKHKRRSSKPDFRPLLHRQDTKARRGSKQLENLWSPHRESTAAEDRMHGRRDSKLYSWLNRQDSKAQEDSEKPAERRPSGRRDSKSSDSWLYIWLHRQDSKSQDAVPSKPANRGDPQDQVSDEPGSPPKEQQKHQQPKPELLLARKPTHRRISRGPKLAEIRLQRRRTSCHVEELDADVVKDEKTDGRRRDSLGIDSQLCIVARQLEEMASTSEPKLVASHTEAASRPSLQEDSGEEDTTRCYPRRNSKSQDSKLLGWFTRRDSKAFGAAEDDDKVLLGEGQQPPDSFSQPSSHLVHRRNSKLYGWLMRANVKLQDECNPQERKS